jgi:hypothetical protein
VPLPAILAAAVAAGKAVHTWANTPQGKAVIRTAQVAIAYHMDRKDTTGKSAQALRRSVQDFSKDVGTPAVTHIVNDVRNQLRPPVVQRSIDGTPLWVKRP